MDEGVVGEPGSWQIRHWPLPRYPPHMVLKLVPTSIYSQRNKTGMWVALNLP